MGVKSEMADVLPRMYATVGQPAVVHASSGDISTHVVCAESVDIEAAEYEVFRVLESVGSRMSIGDTIDITDDNRTVTVKNTKKSDDGLEYWVGVK